MFRNFRRYSLYLVLEIIVLICQYTIFIDRTSDIIGGKSIRSTSGLTFLGSIIIFFITPLLAGYLATINKNILTGKRKKFREELSEGISYYWSVLGGTLLVGLMMAGVIILMVIFIAVPLIGILGAIAGFLFIIYLAVKYSALTEAIVYRDCGVSEGMDACKNVTKEYFGELFILIIPASALSIISNFVAGVYVLFSISVMVMLYSMFASYYRITLISREYGEEYNEVIQEEEEE
ncbi:hypothetical protein [Oceanirhabdus sp. W0125-5]|uniref:hypothetical protein n=1 Tax=Oceanirhabdus sp. W0125-5 TaxID=2999116 RepID=UPI0022F2F9F4|nr:hypothetical protein [Oceanirhabdus sp. W0125-5]WBW98174.1 hypothetical protein OW730_05250 [Oceanirhabdus sp. W0125-5]